MSTPAHGDAARPDVAVLSPHDPASPRTNSIADLRLCAGLAQAGHQVELVAPAVDSTRPDPAGLLHTYGLAPTFLVRRVPAGASGAGVATRKVVLGLAGRLAWSVATTRHAPIVISRDARLLMPFLVPWPRRRATLTTALWLHEYRGKRVERFAAQHATCVLATNTAILRAVPRADLGASRAFVTGNPVLRERAEFGRSCARADARARLEIEGDSPVVVYTGKLYRGMKELEYLLMAAARMPSCTFLFTGGRTPVIDLLRADLRTRGLSNVRLAGMLDNPEEVRYFQQAADVLVAYYSREDHPYADHNLPNKLAEYMTTGNLIVAADFPALGDLLSQRNAILVKPDDPAALARAIDVGLRDPGRAASLGARAQADVARWTSEAVGAELSEFLVASRRPAGAPVNSRPT